MRVFPVICGATLITLATSAASAQFPRPSEPGASTASSDRGDVRNANAAPVSATRQTTFSIPFTVDESAGEITEVQLHVSNDLGQTWQLYARQKPSDTRFHFRAGREGEYWFASRTVDGAGRAVPETIARPQSRVIVDTTLPQITFSAKAGAAGDVQTSWEAKDLHLAPQSFKLEYQAGLGEAWQAVAVEPAANSDDSQTLRGQITWWPKTTSRFINVRAEVLDIANNRAVVNQRVFLPTTSKSVAAQSARVFAGAGAVDAPPVDPFARAARSDMNGAVPRPPSQPLATAANKSLPPTTTPYDAPRDIGPPAAGQFISSQRPADPPAAPPTFAPGELPNGERPRMTNSKRFELDYAIDSAGPGGVKEVELWMTTDRGATWTRWGIDQDQTSPFEVELESEGIYGFRIVIVSNSGLASPKPQPGEPADLWVGVDVTPPTAQIASVAYGEGAHVGELEIRWEAEDARLGSRPVTLSFAEAPDGPWTTIAAGLPNTGQYYWLVDSRVPKKIILRLEVRDEADNTASHQLAERISLEGLNPGGRIRGVIRPAAK